MVALLDLYEVTDPQRAEVLALLVDAGKQGWLRPYHSDLPEAYTTYISFEAEADGVRNYESLYIPGILQTEDYARAVIRGVLPTASQDEVQLRVQARMERQGVLTKDEPLKLWAIIDEAALHRMVGGHAVMRAQMERLITATHEPHVTVQVISLEAGAHSGMAGSFILLDFPDPSYPEVVYIESMAGDLFLEAGADVRRYSVVFDNLRAVALGPSDSASLIATLVGKIK